MSEPFVLEASGISKKFTAGMRGALRHAASDIGNELTWWRKPVSSMRPGEFWALHNVTLKLERGRALGVIGANGAGKSTLLKLLSGLLKPDMGRVVVRGRLRAMIELGAAFTPSLTGRENVFVQASLYGYKRGELASRLDSIVDFSGLEQSIDAPVQQYSDGMRARLGFAVAVHLDPDVLLVDEVLAVGDIAFQNKCLRFIRDYLARGGSLVFVGHGTHQVQSVCDDGLVLHKGETMFSGGIVESLDYYLHSQKLSRHADSESVPREPGASNSRSVTIDQVLIAPTDAETIRSGEPLRISVQYTAAGTASNVGLGFTIYSADSGACIAGGSPVSSTSLEAGTHWLTCRIPVLPVLAGEYSLRVYLLDRDLVYPIATSGWDDAVHRLTVKSEQSALTNLTRIASMHVGIASEWEEHSP